MDMSTETIVLSQKKIPLDESIKLPETVSGKFVDGKLTIRGPLGSVEQDFSKIPVSIKVGSDSVLISILGSRRKNRSVMKTASSLINNAIQGVMNGFVYKLKVIYAHFPVTVKIQGKKVLIENFYGERSPRVADIVGETKVEVQGEDLIVTGVSIQDVGQTAANIEQSTTVKRKDQRVFLDGVYIYARTRQ